MNDTNVDFRREVIVDDLPFGIVYRRRSCLQHVLQFSSFLRCDRRHLRLPDLTMSLSQLVTQQNFADAGSVSECATVVGGLGDLLEQEYFLFDVLAYVVDDGLHECRLVCRQWREACRKLPVKIRANGSSIRVAEVVKQVAEQFPEAASLCLVDSSRKDGLGADALPWLSRLAKLHTLQVPFPSGHQVAERLRPILLSMNHLRSLSFRADDQIAYSIWMGTLRCLVHLTFLDLCGPSDSHAHPESITELQRLQHLSGNIRSLVKSDGRLVFPSLTRLTELRFPDLGTQDWTVNLQVRSVSYEHSEMHCVYSSRSFPMPHLCGR